jgi:hypothetical protein
MALTKCLSAKSGAIKDFKAERGWRLRHNVRE